MKKLLFLFVVSFTMLSCSENSESIDVQKQDIIGTWKLWTTQ